MEARPTKTRAEFFPLRLAPTAVTLLVAAALVSQLWYPGAYFGLAGVAKLIAILVAVNLIIGPGLSTFVYRPGKPRLALDLWLLGILEVAVLVVAVVILYQRQPWFTVFAVDRFESVTRAEVDMAQLSFAGLQSRPGHRPRLVFAELPRDQAALE